MATRCWELSRDLSPVLMLHRRPADNTTMRRCASILLVLCTLVTSGCLSIEQTMTFERNLSGTADIRMQIDLEPIVGFMAMTKASMGDKPTKPTEADMAAVRKELMASMGQRKPV